MKTAVTVALISMACLGNAVARADDAGKVDRFRMQGVWVLSSGETNGRPLEDALQKRGLDGLTITISENIMTMSGIGAPDHTYEFTLKPANRPRAIQLITLETDGKAPRGTVLHGIYEIENARLKLCLPSDSSVEKPDKFEAPSGSRLSLLVLRRPAEDRKTDAEQPDPRETSASSRLRSNSTPRSP